MVAIVSVNITGLLIERDSNNGPQPYHKPRIVDASSPGDVEHTLEQSLNEFFAAYGIYADLQVEVQDPTESITPELVFDEPRDASAVPAPYDDDTGDYFIDNPLEDDADDDIPF